MVFAGTTVVRGRGKVLVTATGMATEFGAVAKAASFTPADKTPLERRMGEIGRWLGVGSLVVCGLVAGVSIVREMLTGSVNTDFVLDMVVFAVALAVAAVPEALPAIVTGALAIGMRRMAKKNALVRKMSAVETLGCTTVICADKTGTLTNGEMTVTTVVAGGMWFEVTGVGYTSQGAIKVTAPMEQDGKVLLCAGGGDAVDLPSRPLELLLRGAVLCNDADVREQDGGRLSIHGDPTEGALLVLAVKGGISLDDVRRRAPRVDERPFTSERKYMATLHQSEGGGCSG